MNTEPNILEFLYQETAIHFLLNPNDKDVMINATEMGKMFGKRTTNYLANDKTKELIKELELTGKSVNSNEKILENRGHIGYFFCEILALDFATWLDVKFKVWIYKTIKEILNAKSNQVAKVVTKKQLQIIEREGLIAKAIKENNTIALDLLKNEKELKRSDYLQKKAVKVHADQYKWNF